LKQGPAESHRGTPATAENQQDTATQSLPEGVRQWCHADVHGGPGKRQHQGNQYANAQQQKHGRYIGLMRCGTRMLFHGFFSVSCEPYHPDAATTDHYTFRENSFADLRIDSPKLIV
jgi:hypothetical protein